MDDFSDWDTDLDMPDGFDPDFLLPDDHYEMEAAPVVPEKTVNKVKESPVLVPPTIMEPQQVSPIPERVEIIDPVESEIRKMTVTFNASGNMEQDVRTIRLLQGALLSYNGLDTFAFHIFEEGKGVMIDFPNHTTGICPELIDRLTKLLGPDHYRIDPVEI